MDQRAKNILFMNRFLAAFVEDVLKDFAARDPASQNELIKHIKEDILGILKNRFDKEGQCTGKSDCPPDRECDEDGFCVPKQNQFSWPFIETP